VTVQPLLALGKNTEVLLENMQIDENLLDFPAKTRVFYRAFIGTE
jgi:hypothetical protein